MNRLSIITAFLGGVKNRYLQYQPERGLREKLALARKAGGFEGLELCYPADFQDPAGLGSLLAEFGFGVSAVNARSRRPDRWFRGSFTAENPAERRELVDDFKRAIDAARRVGTDRITTCPLNDGHDYVFEMNYFDAYRYAEETFGEICRYDPAMRICIEYKVNDPRTRCLFASAGETLAFCQSTGLANLGVTLDFGHSLLAAERPAQSVALLSRAGKLFYVHLNDNDRAWDWDMLPGAFNLPELIEFFFYLEEAGYTDDWYAYDVMSKETDTVETFAAVSAITRKIEGFAAGIDHGAMKAIMKERNPIKALSSFYGMAFRGA